MTGENSGKICLIDSATSGHHPMYLKCLLSGLEREGIRPVLVLPSDSTVKPDFVLDFPVRKNRFQFLTGKRIWLMQAEAILKSVRPQVVHFLYGDHFFQLGGVGLKAAARHADALAITQHQVRGGFKNSLLLRRTMLPADRVIVHTEDNKRTLLEAGVPVDKIRTIDCAVMHRTGLSKEDARGRLGIFSRNPVLLAAGGTRFSKGLDILLEALQFVRGEYCLVIAGKEDFFTRGFIEEKVNNTRCNTIVRIKELSDEEFGWYCDASDCIVLPYRKIFRGTSGPLTEAVWRRKPVIGPDHGSLRDLIGTNHLGYLFESENAESLAGAIDTYLRSPGDFSWTDRAEAFRTRITPENFVRKHLELYRSTLFMKQ